MHQTIASHPKLELPVPFWYDSVLECHSCGLYAQRVYFKLQRDAAGGGETQAGTTTEDHRRHSQVQFFSLPTQANNMWLIRTQHRTSRKQHNTPTRASNRCLGYGSHDGSSQHMLLPCWKAHTALLTGFISALLTGFISATFGVGMISHPCIFYTRIGSNKGNLSSMYTFSTLRSSRISHHHICLSHLGRRHIAIQRVIVEFLPFLASDMRAIEDSIPHIIIIIPHI